MDTAARKIGVIKFLWFEINNLFPGGKEQFLNLS